MRRTIRIILTSEECEMLDAIKEITGQDNSECVAGALEFWLRKLTREVKDGWKKD